MKNLPREAEGRTRPGHILREGKQLCLGLQRDHRKRPRSMIASEDFPLQRIAHGKKIAASTYDCASRQMNLSR